MTLHSAILFIALSLQILCDARAFFVDCSHQYSYCLNSGSNTNEDFHADVDEVHHSRRSLFRKTLSLVSLTPIISSGANAENIMSTLQPSITTPNLNCLTDLPPITPDHVRVFLCRHGQTEFNRLNKVQGSRIDPPLNDTGRRMATRLGKALGAVNVENDPFQPNIVFHSQLQRARETANIASRTLETSQTRGKSFFETEDEDILKSFEEEQTSSERLKLLTTLGEVDFGSVNEGKSSIETKADRYAIYAAWSIGQIDRAPAGGGETGRSIMTRAGETLNMFAEYGSASKEPLVAVSHSTYLRMVLALAMEIPLSQGATLSQSNCCVNVLDISMKRKKTITASSNIFGGPISLAPKDYTITIPEVKVIRVNEDSHLNGLL